MVGGGPVGGSVEHLSVGQLSVESGSVEYLSAGRWSVFGIR